MGSILRADVLIPVLALIVAGVALWQALGAQSRADRLAHDLSIADGQLRSLGGYGPAGAAPRASGEDAAADPPAPALPPTGPSPAPGRPGSNP